MGSFGNLNRMIREKGKWWLCCCKKVIVIFVCTYIKIPFLWWLWFCASVVFLKRKAECTNMYLCDMCCMHQAVSTWSAAVNHTHVIKTAAQEVEKGKHVGKALRMPSDFISYICCILSNKLEQSRRQQQRLFLSQDTYCLSGHFAYFKKGKQEIIN